MRALMLPALLFITTLAFPQERPRRTEPPTKTSTTQKSAPLSEEIGDDDVIRVDTSLVTVPVSVMDREGRFVYDLKKEDVQIFENDVEQEIAVFESVETPFTVVLMLDTSSSVWKKLDRIKDAAVAFVDQLRPNDRVMVVSFAKQMTVHCQPTDDRERVKQTIRGIGKGVSTHFYKAVSKVMTKVLADIKGRKAIIVFTDGVDSSNEKTAKQTLHYAEELDALIYTIRFDTYDAKMEAVMQAQRGIAGFPGIFGPAPPINNNRTETLREMYERARHYMQELSRVTGGRYFEASRDLHDLNQSFGEIADELRRQYRLGYYPAIRGARSERRQLRVRTRRRDVAVRARPSYIYVPVAGNTRFAAN
jgi:VWFA-related protein